MRALVQAAATAVGERRRELRHRASHLRRLIVRISSLRQLMVGPRGRECHAKSKRPTDLGHSLRSADRVLAMFAARIRKGYGENAEGDTDPKDIIRKAGEAVASLQLGGMPQDELTFGREAWHKPWAKT